MMNYGSKIIEHIFVVGVDDTSTLLLLLLYYTLLQFQGYKGHCSVM